jgi:hypothetical protein
MVLIPASKDMTASLGSPWDVIADIDRESEFCCAAYPLTWFKNIILLWRAWFFATTGVFIPQEKLGVNQLCKVAAKYRRVKARILTPADKSYEQAGV